MVCDVWWVCVCGGCGGCSVVGEGDGWGVMGGGLACGV